MKSLWNDKAANAFSTDPLALRVYSSQLIGGDPSLVLHGGGNTSVKMSVTNLFGDPEQVLYVKGSGWDLATIEAPGFAPVRMDTLLQMAELDQLTDTDMVKHQRAAMLDPYAPNPSVEAILHALIPFAFVDHTHADAVVTITNTPGGKERIREIFGPNMLVIPYVMPGFLLAKKVHAMTRTIDWHSLDGIILMNHGVFTFSASAKESYERHLEIVSQAEAYIETQIGGTAPPMHASHLRADGASSSAASAKERMIELDDDIDKQLSVLSALRYAVSQVRGQAILAQLDDSNEAIAFASVPNISQLAVRGLLTPDHSIRTKRIPLVLSDDEASQKVAQNLKQDLAGYSNEYEAYFQRHANGTQTQLDSAPRWAVWKGIGTVDFGVTPKEVQMIRAIKRHTIRAITTAEQLGGWSPLGEKDIFDVEYWELEQAKLGKDASIPELTGKIALVTGGASGIGLACVEELRMRGAVVAALDINPNVESMSDDPGVLGIQCDVTDDGALRRAIHSTIRQFGGLDILILNAGIFPASQPIADIEPSIWDKSVAVNLTSQQRLLQRAVPHLRNGIEPAVVIIASKNVPAPGQGAAAYSVTKAGVTQLGRVAALELASSGIRVNMLHPNAVFDTALWTTELLEKRAASYGITVEEYKTNNLLQIEVRSKDVAVLACFMAGPTFSRTTGAQIPIDGGNERVI
ncbi:MAG: bifunctional aldolase/short-chain dehydrogenase [Chloroflexota bacterium]